MFMMSLILSKIKNKDNSNIQWNHKLIKNWKTESKIFDYPWIELRTSHMNHLHWSKIIYVIKLMIFSNCWHNNPNNKLKCNPLSKSTKAHHNSLIILYMQKKIFLKSNCINEVLLHYDIATLLIFLKLN